MPDSWDAIIIGGGAAGLSAALMLGRARRRVLLCDSGEYRNAATPAMHGFPTQDGSDPAAFRDKAREELARYPSIRLLSARALGAECGEQGFTVEVMEAGQTQATTLRARKLLLATGLVDELPDLPGLREIYGRQAWHCPYCDGFEQAGRPLAIHGGGMPAVRLAMELRGWSEKLTLCTGGETLNGRERGHLAALGIALREEAIAGLALEGGRLRGVNFTDGGFLPVEGLFLAMPQRPRSDLAQRLGCGTTRHGNIRADRYGASQVPGLFVAGDIASGLQMVLVAAAQGSMAGFAINTELLREDFAHLRRQRPGRGRGRGKTPPEV